MRDPRPWVSPHIFRHIPRIYHGCRRDRFCPAAAIVPGVESHPRYRSNNYVPSNDMIGGLKPSSPRKAQYYARFSAYTRSSRAVFRYSRISVILPVGEKNWIQQ